MTESGFALAKALYFERRAKAVRSEYYRARFLAAAKHYRDLHMASHASSANGAAPPVRVQPNDQAQA
jgi:hypothetical protein